MGLGYTRLDFGTLLRIVVLCVSVSVVNADRRDHNSTEQVVEEQFTAERIVGGTAAPVGEYPYFGTYFLSTSLATTNNRVDGKHRSDSCDHGRECTHNSCLSRSLFTL